MLLASSSTMRPVSWCLCMPITSRCPSSRSDATSMSLAVVVRGRPVKWRQRRCTSMLWMCSSCLILSDTRSDLIFTHEVCLGPSIVPRDDPTPSSSSIRPSNPDLDPSIRYVSPRDRSPGETSRSSTNHGANESAFARRFGVPWEVTWAERPPWSMIGPWCKRISVMLTNTFGVFPA